jgi:hypothetical protein
MQVKESVCSTQKLLRRMQVTVVGGSCLQVSQSPDGRGLAMSLKEWIKAAACCASASVPALPPQSRRSQVAAKQEAGRCLAVVLEGSMLWLGRGGL